MKLTCSDLKTDLDQNADPNHFVSDYLRLDRFKSWNVYYEKNCWYNTDNVA